MRTKQSGPGAPASAAETGAEVYPTSPIKRLRVLVQVAIQKHLPPHQFNALKERTLIRRLVAALGEAA